MPCEPLSGQWLDAGNGRPAGTRLRTGPLQGDLFYFGCGGILTYFNESIDQHRQNRGSFVAQRRWMLVCQVAPLEFPAATGSRPRGFSKHRTTRTQVLQRFLRRTGSSVMSIRAACLFFGADTNSKSRTLKEVAAARKSDICWPCGSRVASSSDVFKLRERPG